MIWTWLRSIFTCKESCSFCDGVGSVPGKWDVFGIVNAAHPCSFCRGTGMVRKLIF